MLKGFKEFIFRGNVVDLAIAVVIGASFTSIVNALVTDIITPLIGIIGGQPDFSYLKITVRGTDLLIGDFINALISFLIIAAVVYFLVVMPMSRVLSRMKKGKDIPADEKSCPECLSLIPAKAHKCKFCTSIQLAKS